MEFSKRNFSSKLAVIRKRTIIKSVKNILLFVTNLKSDKVLTLNIKIIREISNKDLQKEIYEPSQFN